VRPGKPSRTAIAAASARAAHLLIQAGPHIHVDNFARKLIGNPEPDQLLESLQQWNTPSPARVCAYFALRHRFAEDQLQIAIERGVRQVVLLGAGLDSLALRRPALAEEVTFVEVDHPDSQRWKRSRLEELGLDTRLVVYVPVDFSKERLADRLANSGVKLDEPTYYSWLGVTQYVDRPSCDATLAFIAGRPPGSQVVLDFIVRSDSLSPSEWAFSAATADKSAIRGEPWLTYFDPIELETHLATLGFAKVHRLTPQLAATRYYADQPVDVTPLEAWQLISAEV